MPEPAAYVRGLRHVYATAGADVQVLNEASFTLPEHCFASLQGPSGSGKTTLLSILGGLLAPQEGQVRVAGTDLSDLSSDELARFRRESIGFVFQHFGLLETLTAAENVELAYALDGRSRRARRAAAAHLLDAVGLAHRATHLPHALSGGERQRVAIARALVNEPSVILADEPTGNLDGDSAHTVVDLLMALRHTAGCAIVVVTHDADLASRAETQLRIRSGTVTTAGNESGPPVGVPIHELGHRIEATE